MPSPILHDQAKRYARSVPEIEPGYTVRVHERIQEGGKERVQAFEGLVISVHNGHVPTDRSFTVRRVVSGIGVEKVFPLMSPSIEKIEVKKIANVRRSKLFFLRGRAGKSARLSERFTNEGEFADVVPEARQTAASASSEAPAAEETVQETASEVPEQTTTAEAPANNEEQAAS
jgi:large subunit ribosomal protein L19